MPPSANATLSPERSGDPRDAGGEQVQWALLVSRVLHPIKVAYIEALTRIGLPISPLDMARMYDDRLDPSHIRYHLATLVEIGVIEVVDDDRREATRHLYDLVPVSRWS